MVTVGSMVSLTDVQSNHIMKYRVFKCFPSWRTMHQIIYLQSSFVFFFEPILCSPYCFARLCKYFEGSCSGSSLSITSIHGQICLGLLSRHTLLVFLLLLSIPACHGRVFIYLWWNRCMIRRYWDRYIFLADHHSFCHSWEDAASIQLLK